MCISKSCRSFWRTSSDTCVFGKSTLVPSSWLRIDIKLSKTFVESSRTEIIQGTNETRIDRSRRSPGGLFFFLLSVLSFVFLCISLRLSASPKKKHVSAFLGVSYKSHVTQMAHTGHANFDRNSLFSTILTLNQVLEEESECQGKGLSTQQMKTAVVAMNL